MAYIILLSKKILIPNAPLIIKRLSYQNSEKTGRSFETTNVVENFHEENNDNKLGWVKLRLQIIYSKRFSPNKGRRKKKIAAGARFVILMFIKHQCKST